MLLSIAPKFLLLRSNYVQLCPIILQICSYKMIQIKAAWNFDKAKTNNSQIVNCIYAKKLTVLLRHVSSSINVATTENIHFTIRLFDRSCSQKVISICMVGCLEQW